VAGRISKSERRIIELEGRIAAKKQQLMALQNLTRQTYMEFGQREAAKIQETNRQAMAETSDDVFNALSQQDVGNDVIGNLVVSADPLRAIFNPQYVRYQQWAAGVGIPETPAEAALRQEIGLLEGMVDLVSPIEDKPGVWDKQYDDMQNDKLNSILGDE
jgi:hypothetical protein